MKCNTLQFKESLLHKSTKARNIKQKIRKYIYHMKGELNVRIKIEGLSCMFIGM